MSPTKESGAADDRVATDVSAVAVRGQPPRSSRTTARLSVLEWCHRTAAGRHEDLDWVDATVEVHREIFRTVAGPDGEVRFQHLPYAGFQPVHMLEAAAEAQSRGVPTLQEGLLLLFARAEWTIASRNRTWTSLTPFPSVLRTLVEAYGIEAAVHQDHPEVLARLVALLPGWFPARGTLGAARRILDAAELGHTLPAVRTAPLTEDAPAELAADLAVEVLACRSLAFWEARAVDGAGMELRIVDEVVLFQTAAPGFPLRREDLAFAWRPGDRPPPELARLLPPWTVLRPYLDRPELA